MPRSGGSKYYAVANGRQNGVYTDWGECSNNVTGYSGAIYKSFPSRAQAEAYVRENQPQQCTSERVTYRSSSSSSSPSSSSSSYHATSTTPIEIYTDGSSRGNGTNGASAGYGVYFGHGDSRNISARLPGARQTNQRAELMAIVMALKAVPSNQAVIIKTDSQYSISCFTVWKTTWLRNGWKNARGQDVENRDLVQDGLELIEARRSAGGTTMLQKVSAHTGLYGNEMADHLANEAAMMPLPQSLLT